MNKIDRKIIKTAKWIQRERNNHVAVYWKCDTFQKCKSVAKAIVMEDVRKVNKITRKNYKDTLWGKIWKNADKHI